MAVCFNPYRLKDLDPYTGEPIHVPCGKCPECTARNISGWSFRLQQHAKSPEIMSSHFVTLTYNTDHVPFTRAGFMTLNKRDLQKFFKRLRKRHVGTPIKYFAVGEYGSKKMRPHYHLIMYNAQPADIVHAWTLDGKSLGDVHFGTVTGASIGYTLKYMSKPGKIPLHRNDDRVPEFRLMSKGLGLSYLTIEMFEWHLADELNRMHCVLEDGRKIAMPRYYKDWIYLDSDQRQRITDHLAKETNLRQAKYEAAMHKRYGDQWQSIHRQNQVAASLKQLNESKKRKDL